MVGIYKGKVMFAEGKWLKIILHVYAATMVQDNHEKGR